MEFAGALVRAWIVVMLRLGPMIACVDVHYLESGGARAAVVAFPSFDAGVPSERQVVAIERALPYESGAFYKRELPCLRRALEALAQWPEVVIVDGHAWLDAERPGLGARLLDAEPKIQTVIGVAKTRFAGAPAEPVLRGSSKVPLWVDEAGVPIGAPSCIRTMHGPHRIPTMLRLADQLCRGHS